MGGTASIEIDGAFEGAIDYDVAVAVDGNSVGLYGVTSRTIVYEFLAPLRDTGGI